MREHPDAELIALSVAFLQESVFASRAASHSTTLRLLDGASGCGKGPRPVIPEDFNPRQADLLARMLVLRAVTPSPAMFDTVRDRVGRWVKIQDGIDRQRSHFIKDFRDIHGFEHASWAAPVQAEFKERIDVINADNRVRLDAAAGDLAALLGAP